MKRSLLVVCLMAVLVGRAFSAGAGLDLGLGATFEFGDNAAPDESDPLTGALNSLLNLLTAFRAGVFFDGRFDLAGPLSVGAELGIFAFVDSDDEGDTTITPLIDIPSRGFVRVTFGTISLQAHAGYNFATFIDLTQESGMATAHKFDVGGRVAFGGFYIEYDRLFWAEGKRSGRFGTGILLHDLL